MESKPIIHFVLINESKDVNKYSKFLYYSILLKLQLKDDEIMIYECEDDKQVGSQDRINSWFTDIMMKKGRCSMIIVKHQEKDFVNMSDIFDARMHAFHCLYNHFITNINLISKHNVGDEFYFVLMAHQMVPSIWDDYLQMKFGHIECQRFLDLDHYPDNPSMNFD